MPSNPAINLAASHTSLLPATISMNGRAFRSHPIDRDLTAQNNKKYFGFSDGV
jgi:hypothetical protein